MGRRTSLTVAISVIGLVLAGCASSGGKDTAGGGTPTPGQALPAGLVVFRIETSGGFVPMDYALGVQPSLTIYGDGTAFTTIEEDTYHPVVGLRRGSVDADRLAELIDAAAASALFGDVDYGMPGVTDLGTTTLSFRPREGAPRTASAYALGFGEDGSALGLTAAQQERRHALSALIDDLVESVAYPADGGAWTPTRVQVTDLTDTPPDDPHAAPWPGPDLPTLLSRKTSIGPCGELFGADAAGVFRAAREARTSTWTVEHRTYHLLVRALLPGEASCAS